MLKKASGTNQVPTLTVGSQVQIGYEPGGFNTLLDTAGYPKTAINLPGVAKAMAPALAKPAAPAATTPSPAPKATQ